MRRPAPDCPNILLVVIDALRADAVEPYGGPEGSSPALAGLARRGAAVQDVRATAPWTLPSHIAMFTGVLARSLGLGQAPHQTVQGAAPVVRAQRDRLLAQVLQRSGWETRGITANAWVGKRAGFDTGFDEFVEIDGSRHGELGGRLPHRLRWDLEAVRGRGDDGAAEAGAILARWAAGLEPCPFFWFVNVVDCHAPYLAPKPYSGVSALTRALIADEAFRYLTFEANLKNWLGLTTLPAGALKRMRRQYMASLRYVDDWIGRILAALAETGVIEETLVIVCSDHGENFGESRLITHGASLDDRLLRVPLIVAGPGVEAFHGMRSLAELPSRIATAVGLDEHPWGDGLPAGLPVAQWDQFDVTEENLAELAATWRLGPESVRRLTSPLTCAVSGRFKLVQGAVESDEALYDLVSDPLERAPIRGEEAMARVAGEALRLLRDAVRHPTAQATASVTTAPDVLSDEEVADVERRMRLLGYM